MTQDRPRLPPIEKPQGLKARLLYLAARWIFDKVPSAFTVVYSRNPALARVAMGIERASRKLIISEELAFLIRAKGSLLRGCSFCHDLTLARAFQQKLGMERFADLGAHGESEHFSEGERAVLDYVEEFCENRRASDSTWEKLEAHFSEAEVVEIVWVNATECYYNAMAIPLELPSDELLRAVGGEERLVDKR